MKITSSAFENNGLIPQKYSCDGENISPPLIIKGAPKDAKSLVLMVDDPDAPGGNFNHWVLWNISPETSFIEENTVPEGAIVGMNDANVNAFSGPCPPNGSHRYYFKLYALNSILELSPSSGKKEVEMAIGDNALESCELVGLYKR